MTDGQVILLIVGYVCGVVGMLQFMASGAFEGDPISRVAFALFWPFVVPAAGLGAIGGWVFAFLFGRGTE